MCKDYIVVGAGLFGGVFARLAAEAGKSVLVVDRRTHIGGNCYSESINGVDVHRYGPHIFHTNNQQVWQFVNRFAEFNHFRLHGLVKQGDRLFSFPINLLTLHQLWGVNTPEEARQRLESVRIPCAQPSNMREWALSQIGEELYEIFVRGYTTKQWGRDPAELPSSILKRLPIRLTLNDGYFDDTYQGIPIGGYTRLFENMLDHENIAIETGVDFFDHRDELLAGGGKLVYSGMIDAYFDYRFGELEYRSLRFETECREGDFQGTAMVNYADTEVPYTRIVEHKHFQMQTCDRTVITREYPQKHEQGREAYYPIGDTKNQALYQRYAQLAKQTNILFGGRLGSYRYYDMHQVIAQALAIAQKEIGTKPQAFPQAA